MEHVAFLHINRHATPCPSGNQENHLRDCVCDQGPNLKKASSEKSGPRSQVVNLEEGGGAGIWGYETQIRLVFGGALRVRNHEGECMMHRQLHEILLHSYEERQLHNQ
jgi:hypothetical protein